MAQVGYPQVPQLEAAPGGPAGDATGVSSQIKEIFFPESPKDQIMRNAADTQGPHAKTDDEGQKKVDETGGNKGGSDNGSQKKGKAGDETRKKKQRWVVNRVLTCPDLDYYKILGVEESAKTDEIRKAFIKLSLLTHPDKSDVPDTVQAFRSEYTSFT